MRRMAAASLGLIIGLMLMNFVPVLSGGDLEPPSRSNDPTLSNGGVTPTSGDPTVDEFTFYVWYDDQDYDWPNNMTLNIDDIDIPMNNITHYNDTKMNWTHTDFNFDSGTHDFYFWCYNDNYTSIVRYPSTGTLEFTVTGDYERPELYSWGMSNDDPMVGDNVTFYTYYKDAGGDAPDTVFVEIEWQTYEMQINGTDYTNGVYCWYNYTIPYRSTYRYSFFANDSSRLYDMTDWYSFRIRDRPPVLFNGSVDPKTGDAETTYFNFYVWYRDPDNDYPRYDIYVSIDNNTHWLPENSGGPNGSNYRTGRNFSRNIQIYTGTHRYYFYTHFRDENYNYTTIRLPEEGYYTMTAGGNYTPPILYDGSVSPLQGNTSTEFTFSVWYKDADNDPPQYIYADVNEFGNLQMSTQGSDYRNGTRFTANYTPSEPGNYWFYFRARDTTGLESWHEPDYNRSRFTVQGTPGIGSLSNGTVDPPAGGLNGSFIFSVDYHDKNNGYARERRVFIDGEEWGMWQDYFTGNNTIRYLTWVELYGNLSWVGTHSYYFEFLDSQYCKIRYPETGYLTFQVFDHVPRLWNVSVSPETGDDLTSFTFKVRYQDSENISPSSVQVIIDGKGYDMNPQSTNYNVGVDCTRTLKLGPGKHEYYFKATIPGGAWTQYPGREKYTIEIDGHNELYDRIVTPVSGHTDSVFNLTIKFKDTSGWAPSYVQVFIDNDVFNMEYSGEELTTGATYYYNTKLTKGNHTYYFVAHNDHGTLRAPGLGDYYRITVVDPPVLHAPSMMNTSVDPATGNASTVFNFSARYVDVDGDAPDAVQIIIDGIPHNMTVIGTDYINGTNCYYSTTLTVGNHSYYFYAKDSSGKDVRVPNLSTFILEIEDDTGPEPQKYPPKAVISHSVSGMNATFNGSGSYDPDGSIESHMWDVNGNSYSGGTITVAFSYPGYYVATLTVVDDDGYSDTRSVSFWIRSSSSTSTTTSSSVGGSMVIDKDGNAELVDNETGFSLSLDSVGNNKVTFDVDSDSAGSKMVVLEVSKDVLVVGENEEIMLEINGTNVSLASSLEQVLTATGSTPLYYLIDTGDSYRVVLYMPDAEDKELEITVTDSESKEEKDEKTDNSWLYIILAAIVVILFIIILMSMSKKSDRTDYYEE